MEMTLRYYSLLIFSYKSKMKFHRKTTFCGSKEKRISIHIIIVPDLLPLLILSIYDHVSPTTGMYGEVGVKCDINQLDIFV